MSFGAGLRPDPLGELTELPQLDLRGLLLRGGEEMREEEGDRMGGEREQEVGEGGIYVIGLKDMDAPDKVEDFSRKI